MPSEAQGLSNCTGSIFNKHGSILGDRGVRVVSPVIGKHMTVAPIASFPMWPLQLCDFRLGHDVIFCRVYIAGQCKCLGSGLKNKLIVSTSKAGIGFQSKQGELKVCLGLSSLLAGSAASLPEIGCFFVPICYNSILRVLSLFATMIQECCPIYIIICFYVTATWKTEETCACMSPYPPIPQSLANPAGVTQRECVTCNPHTGTMGRV